MTTAFLVGVMAPLTVPVFCTHRRHRTRTTRLRGFAAEDRLLGMADHLCDVLAQNPSHAWRP